MRVVVEGTVIQVKKWSTGEGTDVHLLQNNGVGTPGLIRLTYNKSKQSIPKQGENVKINSRVFLNAARGDKPARIVIFAE